MRARNIKSIVARLCKGPRFKDWIPDNLRGKQHALNSETEETNRGLH